MQKALGQQFTDLNERKEFLDANADGLESKTYMKYLDAEELQKKKDELAEVSIRIADIEQEISDFKAAKNEELKPMRDEKKELIADIKAKGELVTEDCYKMVDTDEKMVGFYNKEGILVESRPAHREELSPTIMMELRKVQ